MTMRYALALLFVVAAGCTTAPRSDTGSPVELRLLGANPGDYSAALFEVRELQVTANGKALEVEPAQVHIDLTNLPQAWLVGSVRVPAGVERLQANLRLDDFGGFEEPGEAGEIDARAPISFSTGFDRAKPIPEITAILDLAHSLAPTRSDARLLLPQVSVVY